MDFAKMLFMANFSTIDTMKDSISTEKIVKDLALKKSIIKMIYSGFLAELTRIKVPVDAKKYKKNEK